MPPPPSRSRNYCACAPETCLKADRSTPCAAQPSSQSTGPPQPLFCSSLPCFPSACIGRTRRRRPLRQPLPRPLTPPSPTRRFSTISTKRSLPPFPPPCSPWPIPPPVLPQPHLLHPKGRTDMNSRPIFASALFPLLIGTLALAQQPAPPLAPVPPAPSSDRMGSGQGQGKGLGQSRGQNLDFNPHIITTTGPPHEFPTAPPRIRPQTPDPPP